MDNLCVVLAAPRNPLNIGAAARAMSNFGFFHLRLVNPYEVAFREARSAVHAAAILQEARQYPTLAEAIADCSLVVGTTSAGNRELQHTLRRLETGVRLIRKQLGAGRVALLFGSEKFGLSNEDLSYCHWLMRVPTREEHGSMNLGQSVAVCLYEVVRSSGTVMAEKRLAASSEQLSRLTDLLADALRESGYLHSDSTNLKLRRLVRRLNLNKHDVEIWVGIIRQILWKLKGGSS